MKLFLSFICLLLICPAFGQTSTFEESEWPGGNPNEPTPYTIGGYTWTLYRSRQQCCTSGGQSNNTTPGGSYGLLIESSSGGWISSQLLPAGTYTVTFNAKVQSDGSGPLLDVETSTDGAVWTGVQTFDVTTVAWDLKLATVTSAVPFYVRLRNPLSLRPVIIDDLVILPLTLLPLDNNGRPRPQIDNNEKPLEYVIYNFTGQILYRGKQFRTESFRGMPLVIKEVYKHRTVSKKVYYN